MNTWEAEEKEWKKYSSDFNKWLELYTKREWRADEKAMAVLKGRSELFGMKAYPDDLRKNIQRGYDIQLAYDQWRDNVYSRWFDGYRENAMAGKAVTFDQLLEDFSKKPACTPKEYLTDCGPIPDWRDAEDKIKEQEMMRKADEEAARIAAKQKRK